MRIQPINIYSYNDQRFNGRKLDKINNVTKPDPVKEMNKNFTRAAIAILLIELGMITATHFKNKSTREPKPTQKEVQKPDAVTVESITLWTN